MSKWDTLAASSPVNAGAARSAFGGGAVYREPTEKFSEKFWTAPPPLRPQSMLRGIVNLTGLRVGRLTVVGVLDAPSRSRHRATWVCRCTCGGYCGRWARSLTSPATDPRTVMCQRCAYVQRLRENGSSHRVTTGR